MTIHVRRNVDGVLLLDKPCGMTSNAALQAVKRLYLATKAGHTGTLDPLATGLLPIAFGEATKFAHMLLDADKRYLAVLRLGVETTTGDAEGEPIRGCAVEVAQSDLDVALAAFRGEIRQQPPMYSALKHHGRPLYVLARQGIEVERSERRVTVHELAMVSREADRITLDIRCSKGTYIRSLAADIGRRLGCGAHLAALRRTEIGSFRVDESVALADLERMSADALTSRLRPIDLFVLSLPRADLGSNEAVRFLQGQPVPRPPGLVAPRWRVYGEESFLGIGATRPDGALWPQRLINRGQVYTL